MNTDWFTKFPKQKSLFLAASHTTKDYNQANGKTHSLTVSIESWMRGSETTFYVYPTSKITEVIIDPDNKLPDVNRKNNGRKPAM